MSNAVRNADECVKALERALEAMNPPLEVFGGILKLIAELVPYVRFINGSDASGFDVSDDGMKATRNASDRYGDYFICASPSTSEGIHKATFRIEKCWYIVLGVVSAAKISITNDARKVGHMYTSDGYYTAPGFDVSSKYRDSVYGSDDLITVRLDLDANTVTFRKNGVGAVGSPREIAHGDAYQIVFQARSKGDAATIVEDEAE